MTDVKIRSKPLFQAMVEGIQQAGFDVAGGQKFIQADHPVAKFHFTSCDEMNHALNAALRLIFQPLDGNKTLSIGIVMPEHD